ncbi:MAG: cell division protein FtsQ/DivIB [Galactobacter sp.]
MSQELVPGVTRLPVRRRHRLVRWLVAAGIVVVLGLVLVLLYLTPVLKVTSVKVEGTRLADEAKIRTLLQPLEGQPMAKVSTEQVERLLADEPAIRDLRLGLRGAHSVTVTVVEYREVAVLKEGQSLYLVGDNGAKLKRISQDDTRKLPVVNLSAEDADGKIFDTVIHALAQLPTDVLSKLESAGAGSVDSVTFTLQDSRKVVWGDSSEGVLKAAALQTLLAQGGPKDKTIDVSTPSRPVTR